MAEAQTTHAGGFRSIPIDLIDPSPHNPRRTFAGIDELAASIKEKGVLLPLIVRPFGDRFELVAGERRLRGAKKAKLAEVPAIVRDLDDKSAREIQLEENLQRQDLNALEEAEGYAELIKDFGYSQKDLALRFKRSESSISAALKLLKLGPEAREAYLGGRLSQSVALLIGRIPLALQPRAVTEMAAREDNDAMPYRHALDWIQRHFMISLKGAPFELNDAKLVASAGSCVLCPKRTGTNKKDFPDVADADVCTDPGCYRGKVDVLVELQFKKAEAGGAEILRGKAVAGVFTDWGEVSPKCGYVNLDRGGYVRKRYVNDLRAFAAKHQVKTVLAQEPKSGRVVELAREADFPKTKAAKKKAATVGGASRKPAGESAAAKEKRLLEEQKEQARILFGKQILGELAAKAEKQKSFTKPQLLALVTLLRGDYEAESAVATRRFNPNGGMSLNMERNAFDKAAPKMSEAELRGVLVELVATAGDGAYDFEHPEQRPTVTGRDEVLKAFGLDIKKAWAEAQKKLVPADAAAANVKKGKKK